MAARISMSSNDLKQNLTAPLSKNPEERPLRRANTMRSESNLEEMIVQSLTLGDFIEEYRTVLPGKAEKLPRIEGLLQELSLSNKAIDEIVMILLTKLEEQYRKEKNEAKQVLERIDKPTVERFCRGWLARHRYKKMVSNYRTVGKLLKEILSTEQSFVQKLAKITALQHNFNAEVNEKKKSWLTPEMVQSIFSNIQVITQFHQEILRSMLSIGKMETPSEVARNKGAFVKIVSKMVPLLPLYRPYVNNFLKANQILSDIKANRKSAKLFLRCECSYTEMIDLLSCPLYRIPEYTEIIGKLATVLDDSSDNANLVELHSQLRSVAKSVQKNILAAENSEKVLAIHQLMGDKLQNDPSRFFIREGVLAFRDPNLKRHYHEGYLFLLSDQILLVNRSDHHKLIRQLHHENLQIEEVEDSLSEENAFSLTNLTGEEMCRFSLKTSEEKKSWVVDIRKVINRYRVFKVPIENLMEREKTSVPSIILDCVSALNTELRTEGLFRISPSVAELKEQLTFLDQGKKVNLLQTKSGAHLVAEVLKRFFRELPDPLLTSEKFSQWMLASGIEKEEDKIEALREIFQEIPKVNREIAKFLLNFLGRVKELSDYNKMGSTNLAIVFGPLLLYPRSGNFQEYAFKSSSVAPKAQSVIQFMIDNHPAIFVDQTASANVLLKYKGLNRTLTSYASWNNSPLAKIKKPIEDEKNKKKKQEEKKKK